MISYVSIVGALLIKREDRGCLIEPEALRELEGLNLSAYGSGSAEMQRAGLWPYEEWLKELGGS